MLTVNVEELNDRLSTYLTFAKSGEEIVIEESQIPVAKLVPFAAGEKLAPLTENDKLVRMTDEEMAEHERYLVATGQMTLPKEPFDFDAFDALPWPEIPEGVSVEAILKDSDEWR
jgi:antitoxin (DNA-binding transcriptional repressor) of toxin-antitoxin stability system